MRRRRSRRRRRRRRTITTRTRRRRTRKEGSFSNGGWIIIMRSLLLYCVWCTMMTHSNEYYDCKQFHVLNDVVPCVLLHSSNSCLLCHGTRNVNLTKYTTHIPSYLPSLATSAQWVRARETVLINVSTVQYITTSEIHSTILLNISIERTFTNYDFLDITIQKEHFTYRSKWHNIR